MNTNPISRVASKISSMNFLDLLSKTTWIMLLLTCGGSFPLLMLLVCITPFVLLSSKPTKSSIFWFTIAGIYAVFFLNIWFTAENSMYLMFYWLLAIGIAYRSEDPKASLAFNARVLLGLVFLIAVIQKILSPDYVSGDFFHHALLFDTRFDVLARVACNADSELLQLNRQLEMNLSYGLETPQPIQFMDLACTAWLVPFLKWWTTAIESLLAILFLLPIKIFTPRLRSTVLLLFCYSTYVAIPIIGFAAILFLLGLAQIDEHDKRFRQLFISSMIIVTVYSIIFTQLLMN